MRHAPNLRVEKYRAGGPMNSNFGLFHIPSPKKGRWLLKVMVSQGAGWDHVSVSLPDRTPTWEEMDHVKNLFFADHEWVMQIHVPKSDNINICQTCLHLWRPQTQAEVDTVIQDWIRSGEPLPAEYQDLKSPGSIPLPPKILV